MSEGVATLCLRGGVVGYQRRPAPAVGRWRRTGRVGVVARDRCWSCPLDGGSVALSGVGVPRPGRRGRRLDDDTPVRPHASVVGGTAERQDLHLPTVPRPVAAAVYVPQWRLPGPWAASGG
jgi:hypothetical protein